MVEIAVQDVTTAPQTQLTCPLPLWGGGVVAGWKLPLLAGLLSLADLPFTPEGEAGWRGVHWQAGNGRSSLLQPPPRVRGGTWQRRESRSAHDEG